METVWITGGKGFIGKNLAIYLANKGFKVIGVGHGSWIEAEYRANGYTAWFNAEITFSTLTHIRKQFGYPKVIYHLAGGSSVAPSIERPYEDFQRTVDTTALLLEWVRQSSTGVKVVGVSSAAVYGSQYSGHILESENLTPFSPYGFHKLMLETLFESYSKTFGLDLAVVRLFSVYGPGLQKQLIWDLCNKIANCNGNQIHLHGKGTESRDWLYISDAVCLLNTVADCSSGNEKMVVVNGGSGIGTTISDIAHSLVDAWGGDYNITFSGESRQGDPVSLIADVNLAKKIGFEAKVDISDGLTNVVRWYKENKF